MGWNKVPDVRNDPAAAPKYACHQLRSSSHAAPVLVPRLRHAHSRGGASARLRAITLLHRTESVEVVGKLSADGTHYWDGQRWLPAISADGRWRWSGTRWEPVAQQPSAAEKGSDLERRIARFFAENGYRTVSNQKLVGRSGGRHEIDVLAERSDGVTSVRIAVECKAWQAPIDKTVIAKAAYVCADLGINKVIVVSLHGWQVGAERAAADQGIELWGPTELEQRLGRIPAALATQGPGLRTASGFRIAVPTNVAEKSLWVERDDCF